MRVTLIDTGSGLPPQGSIVLLYDPVDEERFHICEVVSEGEQTNRTAAGAELRIRDDLHPRDIDPFDCEIQHSMSRADMVAAGIATNLVQRRLDICRYPL